MFGMGGNKGQGGQGPSIPMEMMLDWKCSCGHTFVEMRTQLKVYPGGLYGSAQILPFSSSYCGKCGKLVEIDIKKMKKDSEENPNQLTLLK